MQVVERKFNVDGHHIAVKQWGNPENPIIIALHGWLDNAASYDLLAPGLHDYCVVTIDFAGHGLSSHRPEGMRYHLLDNVDDVVAVADQLGLDRFILMGHSMGAGVSSVLAGAFPERIEKLILLEGIGAVTTEADQAPKVLRQAVKDMQQASNKQKPLYSREEDAIKARMGALGGISASASRSLCKRGLVAVEGGYTWRSDPRVKMGSAMRLTEEMTAAYLKALDMPVLLIMGNHSFTAGSEVVANRTKHVANLEYHKVDGNHHLHLEPDTYKGALDLIRRFLKATAAAY